MSEVEFQPFQKVLVRMSHNMWKADYFSHSLYREDRPLITVSGYSFNLEDVISYEGNEHLLGTTDSPPPPESPFKFGDKVEVRNDIKEDWKQALFLFRETCDYPYNVMLPEINGIKSFKYCHHANW